MSESEQEPESDYTQVSVPDEELPEDLRAGEDNPLAGPPADDDDNTLTMPDTDGSEESHRGSDADADSSGAS